MVMGKGGVGKTTIAAAIALGLVQSDKSVHLSTTDPAAHLAATLNGEVSGLTVGRIDPKVETQKFERKASGRIVTPLMRLQDAVYTKIVLVTLPEATPVSQAVALQDDLRRAKIEAFAWVVNQSLLASHTQDPLLRARLNSERKQIERVAKQTTHKVFMVPWTCKPPVGVAALEALLDS
jgi:anion-transporting  ArsA/GET3 family ATPase